MIITLLTTLILVVSAIVLKKADPDDRFFINLCAAITESSAVIVLIGLLVCIIKEHTFTENKVLELQAERNAIVYQMENHLYLGDALGEYNKKILSMRHMHDNPWTSWLQGGYVYEVDPIDLN